MDPFFQNFPHGILFLQRDAVDEEGIVFLELFPTLWQLVFKLWLRKMGKKGQPIKTGQKPLRLNQMKDPRLPFPLYSLVELATSDSFRLDERHAFDNGFFRIHDVQRFCKLFSSYPHVIDGITGEKVSFGPPLVPSIWKDTTMFPAESPESNCFGFEDPEHGERFPFGELYQEGPSSEPILPVFGERNNLGIYFRGTLYPVNSKLDMGKVLYIAEHVSELPTRAGEFRAERDANLVKHLLLNGVRVSGEFFLRVPEIVRVSPKALWKLEREHFAFRFTCSFRYGTQEVHFPLSLDGEKPEDTIQVPAGDSTTYIPRDLKWEQGHLEKVGTFLKQLSPQDSSPQAIVPRHSWRLRLEEVLQLVQQLFPALSAETILECPPELLHTKTVTPRVRAFSRSQIDWFALRFEVALGDTEISWDKFLNMVRFDSHVVEINGEIFQVDPHELRKYRKLQQILQTGGEEKHPWWDSALVQEVQEQTTFQPDERTSAWIRQMGGVHALDGYSLPDGFSGTLRGYQVEGYQWLRFLENFHLAGILADDMGLGKTVQTIAWLLSFKERNNSLRALIVVPRSLLFNWKSELSRFAPGLSTQVYHGVPSERTKMQQEEPDVTITTYATARNDQLFFASRKWDVGVMDEAQVLKNKQTQLFQALKGCSFQHRLALSGTPLENSPFDLKNIFNFLLPGFLGSDRAFSQIVQNNPGSLTERIKPLMLRRRKADVLSELPPRSEESILVEMQPFQEKMYQQYFQLARQDILEKSQDEKSFQENRFQVLTHLLRLRQLAIHAGLFLDTTGHQGVSGKMEYLLELLEELLSEGHSVLVFSQFASMLRILRKSLKGMAFPCFFMDGQTQNRQQVVSAFQQSENPSVFLLSLKVGGVGLNLTKAEYVVLFDPWWNPAVENQAIDRVHRIGQKNPVMVYRIITKDSVEEKVLQVQQKKKEWIEQLVDVQVGEKTFFSREQILGIFEP